MRPTPIRILFGSGSPSLIEVAISQLPKDLPLVVVSEFPPSQGEWIPYHIRRSTQDNLDLMEATLGDRDVAGGVVLLDPTAPYDALRALGESLLGAQTEWFDATGPTTLAQHRLRQRKQGLRSKLATAARLLNPAELQLSLLYRKAIAHGRRLSTARPKSAAPRVPTPKPSGISVVIPSRNGGDLLGQCLPGLTDADEIIVVDNGSDDGTRDWLTQLYPDVVIESSVDPLAFSVAMNRGIARARYSHICALNNDMVVEPGFLRALQAAFDAVPDLFCASAQIFLPEGLRREETGKTVLDPEPAVTDLPLRCDVPLEGEDLSYVLYGSGGCSLYDGAKLAALGGFDEGYTPAYVEDLDLGVRAWSCGWPSVYCAGARVLHQHRTTTSRYYTEQELDLTLEANYTRFLARAISDRGRFTSMWNHQVLRLKALGKTEALRLAGGFEPAPVIPSNQTFLDLVNGQVSVFPGKAATGNPRVLIASPYLPFPLSHGAAVRIYNLIRETAAAFDVILVAFVEEPRTVPRELLELCVEVVSVHRKGSHALISRGRPDTVEEFDTPSFHAALLQTMAKWKPGIVQLEFTQMAVYAKDCRVPTILVEHDITFDLYAQMLSRAGTNDWETRRQYELWTGFEQEAWRNVTRVVTMSDKDRAVVGEHAVTIGNGVDLVRFQPSPDPPQPRRLLFIGSFAHRPNVLALEFFLQQVFPRLHDVTLHVIAGQNHTRFWDLQHPGVEVEGFVSDVRPAYRAATIVIAPLVASAGTNVKIVEAMAMGKAIVSTTAGIHGLELERGRDVLVSDDPAELAALIERLLNAPQEREALEVHARSTAEHVYGWPAMAQAQTQLYRELLELPREK
ncbi:MAG: hypothetical protein RL328_2128 [Acidobacteriota bacterium]